MEPVRWGIIGAARIAKTKTIPGLRKSPLCDVRAIASRSLPKAEAAARELGIPKAYGSYEELLADPEIEAVYIPLPNHLHVPLTLQAARAGKHVLCEKPIALNAAEAEQLRAIDGKVVFQEAFMVRHHPQWRRVRDLVPRGRDRTGSGGGRRLLLSGAPRRPTSVTLPRWRAAPCGTSAVTRSRSPRFVFESEPLRVSAISEIGPTGVDLSTSGAFDFGEGRQLSFWCGMSQGATQFARVVGETGSITVPFPYYDNLEPADHVILDSNGTITRESHPGDAYEHQGTAFARAARGEITLEWGVENAISAMRALDAAARSVASGRWETV